jgi:ATP-dependent DNA helicase RecG
VRLLDARGLGRFNDDAMLVHGGVLTADQVPIVAGLLTLGLHPQQFIPRYVVNLSSRDRIGGAVRAGEAVALSGPIPRLLEAAMDWAAKAFEHTVLTGVDGQLRDHWQCPIEAVRELIGNAPVHRDVDSWSQNLAVEVRLYAAKLVEVCRFVRTSDDARVVETLATGMPRVLESLAAAGLPSARFTDTGIRSTVILRASGAPQSAPTMSPSQRAVLLTVVGGPLRALDVANAGGLKPDTARKALPALVQAGILELRGCRGKAATTCERSSTGAP